MRRQFRLRKFACHCRRDHGGAVLVPHVVLNNENGSYAALFASDDRTEIGVIKFASLYPNRSSLCRPTRRLNRRSLNILYVILGEADIIFDRMFVFYTSFSFDTCVLLSYNILATQLHIFCLFAETILAKGVSLFSYTRINGR